MFSTVKDANILSWRETPALNTMCCRRSLERNLLYCLRSHEIIPWCADPLIHWRGEDNLDTLSSNLKQGGQRNSSIGLPTATPPTLQYIRATDPGSLANTELLSQGTLPSTPWFDYPSQPFGDALSLAIGLGLHTARPVLPNGLPLSQTNHATPAALADTEKMTYTKRSLRTLRVDLPPEWDSEQQQHLGSLFLCLLNQGAKPSAIPQKGCSSAAPATQQEARTKRVSSQYHTLSPALR